MALVRCTCIAELALTGRDRRLIVSLPDPDCDYVPHRLAAELAPGADGVEPETRRG